MNILVYFDEGVGFLSFEEIIRGLKEELSAFSFTIKSANHRDFLRKNWEKETVLLIFPGGRDLPFHSHLQGEANRRIRSFVEEGGSYLGFCAGGYYGTADIEFEKGEALEVCGSRELAFFPGRAIGPAYGSKIFSYESEMGSRAAQLCWVDSTIPFSSPTFPIYYNGGCYFEDPDQFPNVKVLARYDDLPDTPAAIIHCKVGSGQALLSGVHPEYRASVLNPLDPHSKKIFSSLKKGEAKRRLLWRTLLGLSLNILN